MRITKRHIFPREVQYNLQELYDPSDGKYKFKDIKGNAIMTIDPVGGTITFQTDLLLTNNVAITGNLTNTGNFTAPGTNTFAGTNTFLSILNHNMIEETGFGTDQTSGGTPSAETADASPEDAAAAFDGDFGTKWLATGDSSPWLKYQFASDKTITRYTLTSGDDAQDRDPKTWTFEGSNDDSAWTVLDTVTDKYLGARNQMTVFYAVNSTAYEFYRLNITVNWGSADTQLTEFEMMEDA